MTTTQANAPRRGNPAGLVSLVFGVLLLLANIATQALAPDWPRSETRGASRRQASDSGLVRLSLTTPL